MFSTKTLMCQYVVAKEFRKVLQRSKDAEHLCKLILFELVSLNHCVVDEDGKVK